MASFSLDRLMTMQALDPIVDVLLVRQNGRLTGESYVLLTSTLHVDLSLAKNKSYLGRRYVEVFRARKADYYRAVCAEVIDAGGGPPSHHGYGGHSSYNDYERRDRDHHRERERDRHGGGGGGGGYTAQDIGDTTILKLRGLPFSVQDDDIVRWFDDPALGVSALNSDSVFIVHEGGKPSGIAFVEFASNQEAQAAMAKNKQTMGNRYIEIFPANRSDLERFRARG